MTYTEAEELEFDRLSDVVEAMLAAGKSIAEINAFVQKTYSESAYQRHVDTLGMAG